jgi:hypothetical protein
MELTEVYKPVYKQTVDETEELSETVSLTLILASARFTSDHNSLVNPNQTSA